MFTTSDLFGKFHSPRKPLGAARAQVAAATPNELASLFGDWFPFHFLSPTEEGTNSRQRLYPLRVVFWTFLWQVLNPGSSCREAVRKIMAWFGLRGGPDVEEDNSPYCQARQRVPESLLERILHAIRQAVEQRARAAWRFHNRPVIVGDGTTVLMPDTRANQRAFPQSTNQKTGCGLPLMKVVALFSLASGALLSFTTGNKHKSELGLFRRLWGHLKAGAIFLADRGFCDYVTITWLVGRGVDTVLRLNHMRPHDFRKGQRLGRYDRLVTWQKPTQRPRTATQRIWQRLPAETTLRLIRYPVSIPGFRSRYILLVTTLLDPVAYPVAELAGLYLRRWQVELFFRHIKTTMQMEMLRCKSPAMVRRELRMHLIAYNLIRGLMVEAASIHDVPLERISFKGSVDTLRHFAPNIAQARGHQKQVEQINRMLAALANDPVPDRPHRVEPRMRKRRPKPFPWLRKPRRQLKAMLCRRRPRKNQGA